MYDIFLPSLEMTQSMVLTEMGYNRKPEGFRPKTDIIYKLAVEPNPVHAWVHDLMSREKSHASFYLTHKLAVTGTQTQGPGSLILIALKQ